MGFLNIVISNQPSYAKGKTSLENIKKIEKLLYDLSEENGMLIDDYYYCYHHPGGLVPEYTRICRCRKPGTLFVEMAIEKYHLDAGKCYFIGDQYTDIKCGKSMGIQTIKITNKNSPKKGDFEHADETACNLYEAVLLIKEREKKESRQ
jgi:D-glycero-D-manno-heptose 1,7-bisphosphate phosphatase